MPNQITPADRRDFLLLVVLVPAALCVWPLFLCLFGE